MKLYVLLNSLDDKYGGVRGLTTVEGQTIEMDSPRMAAFMESVLVDDVTELVACQADRRRLADKLGGVTGGELVVSSRALAVLNNLQCASFRAVPVRVATRKQGELKYYLLHFSSAYHVLNSEKSEFNYFKPVAGFEEMSRIMSVRRFVFNEVDLPVLDLFRIDCKGIDKFIVSEDCVRTIESHGLTGFRMLPVWSSDSPSSEPLWYRDRLGWKYDST